MSGWLFLYTLEDKHELFKKALDQLEGGQIDDFKKSFQQALDNDSDDLLYSLAEELYSLGFSNYSNTIYEKLFKKYPDDDGLKINLAELAIDDDKDDKALNYLSQVSSDSDEYVRSLMVAADLYQTQGMFEISEQKLLEAQNWPLMRMSSSLHSLNSILRPETIGKPSIYT